MSLDRDLAGYRPSNTSIGVIKREPIAKTSLPQQAAQFAEAVPGFQHMGDAFKANPDLLISAIMAKLGERTVELTAEDIQNARLMRPAMVIKIDGSAQIRNFSAESVS